MILLGVSNSPLLVEKPDLAAMVDFVELPGWALPDPNDRPHERLILHNLDLDWSLAAPGAIDPGWAGRLADAIEVTGSPWFSLHLGFASEQVRFEGHMLPVTPPLDRDELIRRFVDVIDRARSLCPVPLLLENADYCPEGAYEHICEPSFIREVLEATNTGLLLDIGHLQVSASWFGVTLEEMLEQLPMDRVREIHISSPRPLDNTPHLLDDVHENIVERDLRLLQLAVSRSRPDAVTIEYRRDAATLGEQIRRVRTVRDV